MKVIRPNWVQFNDGTELEMDVTAFSLNEDGEMDIPTAEEWEQEVLGNGLTYEKVLELIDYVISKYNDAKNKITIQFGG